MAELATSHLRFAEDSAEEPPGFRWSAPGEPYLERLRTEYDLDRVVMPASSDYDRARALSAWVRGLWKHDGDNEPEATDPLSILRAAEQGASFRCVEYSIVLSGALNALAIPARVLGLATQDVETRESGAGHVVTEAYLHSLQKWVMVDGQWDAIPVVGNCPLNAVELQRALAERTPGLTVDTSSGTEAREYFDWIAPYLFYFQVALDGRIGPWTDGDRGQIMLVPEGAREPKVFQRKWPLRDVTYTRSLRAFYSGFGPSGR